MGEDDNLTPYTEDESYDAKPPSGKTDGYMIIALIIAVVVACILFGVWRILT